MDKKIRLGIIGIGMAWERLHYPAFLQLTDKYEIKCVCDSDITKAQGFGKSIGLADTDIYDDYVKMLVREDIDAVDTMVPISENFDVAEAVILAGKHLIAEKPFASTPLGARELIQIKDKQHVAVMVAENFRYDDCDAALKEIVSSGQIGEVVYFIQNAAGDFKKDMLDNTFAAKEWRQHPDFEGAMFLDGGIHDIARMRYLFGDIGAVHAVGRPQDEPFNAYMSINALIKFKNGVTGHYAYFTHGSEKQKPPVGLRIVGTLGQIYLESKDKGIIEIYVGETAPIQRTFIPNNGYYYELLNFYNALTSGEDIVSTPEKELGDIDAIFDILQCCKA